MITISRTQINDNKTTMYKYKYSQTSHGKCRDKYEIMSREYNKQRGNNWEQQLIEYIIFCIVSSNLIRGKIHMEHAEEYSPVLVFVIAIVTKDHFAMVTVL